MAAKKPVDTADARQRIDDALQGVLTPDRITEVVDRVLLATKKTSTQCPNCKKAITVEIDDSRAVSASLGELLNQARGRPGESREDSQPLIVNRKVFLVADASDEALASATVLSDVTTTTG